MLLAVAMATAGCDYTPATAGVGHGCYVEAAWFHADLIVDIEFGSYVTTGLSPSNADLSRRFASQIELLTILASLRAAGKTEFMLDGEAQRRREQMIQRVLHKKNENSFAKTDFDSAQIIWFVSPYEVGSTKWRTEARCFVFDLAKFAAEVLPAVEFIYLKPSASRQL